MPRGAALPRARFLSRHGDMLHACCLASRHLGNAYQATPKNEQGPAMSTAAQRVATHAATARTAGGRRPPSVLREIVYGMSLGVLAGYPWKLHHWSNQRRTREFYSLLDQGKITVVADEPSPGAQD